MGRFNELDNRYFGLLRKFDKVLNAPFFFHVSVNEDISFKTQISFSNDTNLELTALVLGEVSSRIL